MRRKVLPKSRFWTKRDGSKIRISAMSNAHLYNTIKMLDRAADAKWLSMLLFEYAMPSESGLFQTDPDHPGEIWPIYNCLTKEANRRGIDLSGPCPKRTLREIQKDFRK